MTDDRPQILVDALQARFNGRWLVETDGMALRLVPLRRIEASARRRGDMTPGGIIRAMENALGRREIARTKLLPMRWNRDTDLTISAIQALDPWLKDGEPRVWREGFLPQPVVRFTGERNSAGRLLDGFLTSFVNLSCVQRVRTINDYVELLDAWLDAFSAAGLHCGRLEMHGDMQIWQRASVFGITLHIDADGVGIGDAVLLWNADRPENMAADLGSGLERLRWLISGQTWAASTFGALADLYDWTILDAVRTGTLLTMAGIRPAPRGAGSAVRRVLRDVPAEMAMCGLGRLVRVQRAYWAQTGMSGVPWPQVSEALEEEILAGRGA